jgi:hypothetical protein
MIDDLPAKCVYLANRHPRLSRQAFADRWLRHGDIGASLDDPRLHTSVSGLRYCLTVDPSGVLPHATDEHDGVALLALRSVVVIPAFHDMLTTNDIAYADELRTFERPVEQFTMYVASELVAEGDETGIVVIDLIRRRSDVTPVDFLRSCRTAHDASRDALVASGVRRLVRNAAIAPSGRGFAYDVMTEHWFDSVEAVAAAAPILAEMRDSRAEYTILEASTTLVTRVLLRVGRDRP